MIKNLKQVTDPLGAVTTMLFLLIKVLAGVKRQAFQDSVADRIATSVMTSQSFLPQAIGDFVYV